MVTTDFDKAFPALTPVCKNCGPRHGNPEVPSLEKKIKPSEVVKNAKGRKLSLKDFYEEVRDIEHHSYAVSGSRGTRLE